ncbi:MAG: ABC transporter substrate-binding protein [Marmoricola sp.]
MRRSGIIASVLVAGALALSGCGSDSLDSGSKSSGSKADTKVDKDAAAKVPKAIADKGTLTVGTDATYAPNEFLAGDGKTIQGFDIDLFTAVAAKLGLKVKFVPAKFDSIITGVQGSKYDVGVSSFTVNPDREKQATMVSYFNAGTQWVTAKGDPKKVDTDKPCGLTVAVQKGTVQQEEDLPPKEAACKKAGKPVKVLVYEGQDQATAAVVSNKADAMLADSPVVAYAVKQSKGKLEAAGDIYDAAPYGYVLPKDDTEMGDAIVAALTSLKDDGGYEKAVKDWGVEAGAIDDFAVNPKL